jgi:hypothetical protein
MPSTLRETGAGLRWPVETRGEMASRMASSRLTPVLFFFSFLFVVVFILLVFVLFVLVEIEIVLVVVFIFRAEFDRIHAGDRQRSATLIAGQNVSFVQFFFFDVDRGIAFWATDHRN